MGWSCATAAAYSLDAMKDVCVAQTGTSNVYEEKGTKFFFEVSRREYADGAITGSIYKFLPDERCRKSGSFRIEGDGTFTRGPKIFRDAIAAKNSGIKIAT